MGPAHPRLLTVGHGTLSGEAFAELLVAAGVATLVDVRRMPSSRRNPQFNRPTLAATLEGHELSYRWDERLGGRREPRDDSPHHALTDPQFRGYADHMESPEFRAALDELLASGREGPVAIMCAEGDWSRCHRRMIGDHVALVRGLEVRHLRHDGSREDHRLNAGARLDELGERVVYDAGADQPLPGTNPTAG
ncbi:DUF488 domain-containing protein [Egibacter rhizosphaerae]|uniref:DUF488 domain-containing protein n=1 Tax=Egibacter rhizosphaerae TaxID=1670831 RepID=A0A411YEZ1_9ACTN|nr:DUF488 domain-containing protein [Egibacter rhizosphaerae]QBI19751.1 DUF488 domain-containing protein [Egibacter rhizosphaerae]